MIGAAPYLPPAFADHPNRADLVLALLAAEQAGKVLHDFWLQRETLQMNEKRAGDFVSAADLEAETALRTALCAEGDGWMGEETTAARGVSGRCWIVDPLDGTTNFLRGIGHWAVSIALEVGGQRVLGLVYDPLRNESFYALHGAGAYLNGVPLRGAETTQMQQALFGTGIPFGGMPCIESHAAEIARLMPLCAGVRRMGAAALDLAYVACGRLDGFWERRLQPWDVAAGLLILHEAGLTVEGLDPEKRPEDTGTILTACPSLFYAFARVLREA